MQKTWAQSLGWEDPMERGTATHTSILAWRILAWVAKSWTQQRDFHFGASLVAQMVKNLPAIWKTWVWSLVGKIPWRRAWQPTPVFLPGESPRTEEPGGLQSTGSQRIRHNWATKHRGTKILQAMWQGQKNEGKKNDSMISCYNTHVLYSVTQLCLTDSLQPHGQYPSRLLCPWNFPAKNTGVGCHFLLQGIVPTQVSNPCLLPFLYRRWNLYC